MPEHLARAFRVFRRRFTPEVPRQHGRAPIVKHNFSRWLPAIAQTSPRKAALGVAGLAILGVTVGGPATAANDAAAANSASTTSVATPVAPVRAAVPPAPKAKSLDHKFQFQPNYFYCGPAATRIVLSTQGHLPSQDELAKKLNTTTSGTDSAEDTTRVLNSVTKTDAYKTRSIPGPSATAAEKDRLKSDIVAAISKGRAVVVNIAGTATDTDGDRHSYPGGHYVGVVGYRDAGGTVQIADPADVTGGGSYEMKTTDLADWIATRGYSA